MKKYFQVGKITIEINSSQKLLKKIEKRIPLSNDNTEKVNVVLNFSTNTNPKLNFVVNSIEFNEKSFLIKNKEYEYYVENLFSKKKSIININIKKTNVVKKNILRIKSLLITGSLDYEEFILNSIFSYTCIWGLLGIKSLYLEQLFVHAGGIQNKEKNILVSGNGGSGKTSTTFEFLLNQNFKFLCEDFGIVDSKKTYSSPKELTIYNSDLKYKNEIIQKIIKKEKIISKVCFFISKIIKINPRRKINVLKIKNKTNNVNKNEIYFIQKQKNIKNKKIRTDISYNIFNASMRELRYFIEILLIINTYSNNKNEFPKVSNFLEMAEKNYKITLKKFDLYLLIVNSKSSPKEILDKIENG